MNLKLYEIDAAIDAAIEAGTDPETGEITNLEELTALQMQREEKLENIALYIKNLSAIATALKNEIDVLNERRKRTEKKVDRLREMLSYALAGQKFQTPRCAVSFRHTKAVSIADEEAFFSWVTRSGLEDQFLRYKQPDVKRTELSKWLKDGNEAPGVSLEERESMSIK